MPADGSLEAWSSWLDIAPGSATTLVVTRSADGSLPVAGLAVSTDSTLVLYAGSRDAFGNWTGTQTAAWSLDAPLGTLQPGASRAHGFRSTAHRQHDVALECHRIAAARVAGADHRRTAAALADRSCDRRRARGHAARGRCVLDARRHRLRCRRQPDAAAQRRLVHDRQRHSTGTAPSAARRHCKPQRPAPHASSRRAAA
jgi:hypothetical protein